MRYVSTLKRVFFCGSCWFAAAVAAAPPWQPETDGWEFVRREGDVELYRRAAYNTNIPALLGHTQFQATLMDVYRTVSDYDHFSLFIPSVTESRVLTRNGHRSWVYQRLALPLLFADRHYVIEVSDDMHALAEGNVRVSWWLDRQRSASLPSGDAVLPAAFSGFWHLDTVSGSSPCDAVYSIQVEPGGSLPRWLFQPASERYVIRVIDAVRKRLARQGTWNNH